MAKLAIKSENLRRLVEYLYRNNYFFPRQDSWAMLSAAAEAEHSRSIKKRTG